MSYLLFSCSEIGACRELFLQTPYWKAPLIGLPVKIPNAREINIRCLGINIYVPIVPGASIRRALSDDIYIFPGFRCVPRVSASNKVPLFEREPNHVSCASIGDQSGKRGFWPTRAYCHEEHTMTRCERSIFPPGTGAKRNAAVAEIAMHAAR